MKACDFIVKYLAEAAGIKHVFTFAGGTSAMLLDSIVRHGGMQVVPMRHEENVALAADGYSRIKQDIGFALTMSGPGATNMITGIAQSYFDSSPVFYLTGNVVTATYKYDLPLRQKGYQETDIVTLVKPITKKACFVDDISQVANELRSALRECVSGRPGPCLYDIPFDTQKLEVEDAEMNAEYQLAVKTSLREDEYLKVIELLRAAKKPLLLVGGGIHTSGTSAKLTAFARKFKIPVVASLLGKDAFPNDDELYTGFIGSYGNRHANRVLDAADLLIALGTRIDSRQTANVKHFMKNKKIIHVDVDRDVIGSTVTPTVGIHMDLADFFQDFEQFEKSIPLRWTTSPAWLNAIKKVRELLRTDTTTDQGDLNPKSFLRKLSVACPPGTIYSIDVGSHQMWSAQSLVLKEGDRILYSGGLGTMGYAIPAAIGAAFAAPERQVVVVAGDGGFQMSIPELQTIYEFKLPIKMVVMNNGILGLMKNFQDENFNGRYPATVTGYSVPDVVKIAQAYGLASTSINKDSQIEEGIEWLKQQVGPAILEVKVPREWGPYPKVMPGGGLDKQHPPLPDVVESAIVKELL
ncbi:MAG: thiamine pyrophosphate-binding protein [Candidatus Omnitrophota bacterium]